MRSLHVVGAWVARPPTEIFPGRNAGGDRDPSFEWVPDDLRFVRFVGNSGGSPTLLAVCMQRASIHASQMPNPRVVEIRPPPCLADV